MGAVTTMTHMSINTNTKWIIQRIIGIPLVTQLNQAFYRLHQAITRLHQAFTRLHQAITRLHQAITRLHQAITQIHHYYYFKRTKLGILFV